MPYAFSGTGGVTTYVSNGQLVVGVALYALCGFATTRRGKPIMVGATAIMVGATAGMVAGAVAAGSASGAWRSFVAFGLVALGLGLVVGAEAGAIGSFIGRFVPQQARR